MLPGYTSPTLRCALFYLYAGLCTRALSAFVNHYSLSCALPPLPQYLLIKSAFTSLLISPQEFFSVSKNNEPLPRLRSRTDCFPCQSKTNSFRSSQLLPWVAEVGRKKVTDSLVGVLPFSFPLDIYSGTSTGNSCNRLECSSNRAARKPVKSWWWKGSWGRGHLPWGYLGSHMWC